MNSKTENEQEAPKIPSSIDIARQIISDNPTMFPDVTSHWLIEELISQGMRDYYEQRREYVETLQQNAKQNTVLGIGIVHAICEKIPAPEIFTFIKECAKGNRQWVENCIGSELLEEILSL